MKLFFKPNQSRIQTMSILNLFNLFKFARLSSLALALPLLMSPSAHAQMANLSLTPQDIEEAVRLTQTNPCSVYSNLKCYSISSTKILSSNNESGRITFLISASTKESQLIALPFSLSEFNVESVKVNNSPTTAVAILDNQELAVFSPMGGSVKIEVAARIKNSAPSFTLTSNSGYVDTSAVSSLINLSQLDNGKKVVSFIQSSSSTPIGGNNPAVVAAEKTNSIDIAPVAIIERQLILDDKITLKTQVRTQNAPTIKTAKTIILDKIAGEQIITNSASVENDKIKIEYIPQSFAGYESIISSNKISLKNTTPYLQKIVVLTSPAWRLNSTGPSYVQKQKNSTLWWLFPGQALELDATKIVGIDGLDSAIEKVVLRADIKSSPVSFKYSAQINSSVGSKIFLDNARLNKDYDINQILLNGQKVIFNKADKQTLILPRQGINNLEVELLSKTKASSVVETFPTLTLLDENQKEISSRNFHSYITNFSNKWLLFAYGADIKPSILLWGIVLFILAASYILGKYAAVLGLGITSWFLLLTGLTQAGFASIIVAISWFALLYFRRTAKEHVFFQPVWRFNLFQSFLFVLTFFLASALFASVSSGLIGQAHVFIEGLNSHARELYFYNQTSASSASVVWLPVWVYRTLMFAWSIWLAFNVLKWASLFWESYSANGFWKKSLPKPVKAAPSTEASIALTPINPISVDKANKP